MASSEQLRNYLETLSIDPGSCRGFEDEALGACIGLCGFGIAGDATRRAFAIAIDTAAYNSPGTLTAGPANKSFFYHALMSRRNAAFNHSLLAPDWKRFDAANHPWALPEQLFRSLDALVQQGKGLAGEKAMTWDEVVTHWQTATKAIGLATPAGVLGKKLFKSWLVRFAPGLAESAVAEWAIPVTVTTVFLAVTVESIVVPIHNAQVKQAFAIDRKRRDYDRLVAGGSIASK